MKSFTSKDLIRQGKGYCRELLGFLSFYANIFHLKQNVLLFQWFDFKTKYKPHQDKRNVTDICKQQYRRASRASRYPVSILYKSTAGRYRPVSYPDGPITARCRFIKNASWYAQLGKANTFYSRHLITINSFNQCLWSRPFHCLLFKHLYCANRRANQNWKPEWQTA